jgi:nitroreductase
MENPGAPPAHACSDADRSAVYQAIFSRRDVRGQFLPDPVPVPDDVLGRVLLAAHHAPSVGFMPPWNFRVVRAPIVKQRVHDVFCAANAEAERMFPDEKRAIYSRLKLQGIVDSPVNRCVGWVSHSSTGHFPCMTLPRDLPARVDDQRIAEAPLPQRLWSMPRNPLPIGPSDA